MKVDITGHARMIENTLAALSGTHERKRLHTVNFDGSECKSLAQLSAANRVSEFKAAAFVLERPAG